MGSRHKSKIEDSRISVFCTIYPPPYFGGAEGVTQSFVELIDSDVNIIKVHSLELRKQENLNVGRNTTITFHKCLNICHPILVEEKNKGVKVVWHILEQFSILNLIRTVIILLREKPDLVITHNLDGWGFSPWIASKLLRIPSLHYTHDFGSICLSKTTWRARRGACKSICNICKIRPIFSKLFMPRLVIVNSHSLLERIKLLAPEVTKTRITRTIYPLSEDLLKSKAKKPGSSYLIGYIGRISHEKGVEMLLQTCQRMELPVLVAGEGQAKYLEELKKRYPCADFIGQVNKSEYFSMIDINVVPSLWSEPFGRVSIEALLHGVRLIVSDQGGLKEAASLITNDFKVFECSSQESLTAAISQTLSEINMGYEFDWKSRKKDFRKLYGENSKLYLKIVNEILSK